MVGRLVDASLVRTRAGAVALVSAAILGTATGLTADLGVASTPPAPQIGEPVAVTAPTAPSTTAPSAAPTADSAATGPVVVLQAVPPPETRTVVVTIKPEAPPPVTVTAPAPEPTDDVELPEPLVPPTVEPPPSQGPPAGPPEPGPPGEDGDGLGA